MGGRARNSGFFPRMKCLFCRKNPGFSPVRRLRTVTARKLFDLVKIPDHKFSDKIFARFPKFLNQ
ncbi:Uncharacterized protein dnm_013120 [Desulfonema magnum]|uniref:Uncharacterized protein n=1 Tax=Desulfonema magnum TaxID=45655 RepID=A0A975BH32_9BACT|nr:Uncharacterized protein dnm_013120 [Desulfonema magnum]